MELAESDSRGETGPNAATDAALARAKEPAAPLAGPYGHPLHPALVAVPIGAWLTAFTFDVRSFAGERGRDDARAARDAIAVGIAGAAVAAVAGYLDWLRLTPRTKAHAYGTTHALLNLAVTGFYLVAWRQRAAIAASGDDGAHVAGRDLALHAGALGLLGCSGIIGGELAYRFGVRVADEATQRSGHTPGR
ncbi:MAG: hypothetical protein NVS3B28_29160 [Candidatus Velthaea sp.]